MIARSAQAPDWVWTLEATARESTRICRLGDSECTRILVLLTPDSLLCRLVPLEPKRGAMLTQLPRVSSARAAEIVDVGYEGFRSYLKRGLLGRVGMLPGFHRANGGTSDDPSPRSGWTMFGFPDLCLMRIARLLMGAGFTFDSANAVVSQHKIWTRMARDKDPIGRYLLIWPPYGDHIIIGVDDLCHLPGLIKEAEAQGVFTLIDLADVQRYVARHLASADTA